uniref:PDZ domain-containing protein n=1 Tax=Alexandrium monilatum TaxID=311494 RepID=A0A7S4VRJ6_9DINO
MIGNSKGGEEAIRLPPNRGPSRWQKPLPGPPMEFTLRVEKVADDTFFGLDGQEQAMLSVLAVKAGGFADCNTKVHPDLQMRANDVITSVNGVSGSAERMAKLLAQASQAESTVKRSVCLAVIADFGDGSVPMGVEFREVPQGKQLVIASVTQGHLQKQLLPGDRIASVGTFQSTSSELLERLRGQAGKVQLGVVRLAEVHYMSG